MSEGRRARPQPTPETQHFWDGTREGELRLQRCNACGKVYFPPRPFCPACAARDVAVFTASGKGRLYSYVIHHRPVPGFTPPYAIAVVELDEGPHDDQHHRLPADPGGLGARHAGRNRLR